jgi:hypothetical protein
LRKNGIEGERGGAYKERGRDVGKETGRGVEREKRKGVGK